MKTSSNQLTKQSWFYLASGILIAFCFIFFGLYLQGIPYEQEAAVASWREAVAMPWSQLLGYLFSPISGELMANNSVLISTRVTEHVILRLIYGAFKDSLTAIAVYNTLLVVLLTLLIFVFSFRLTNNVLASFLLPVFLLTTPAYGWAIMEYGDFTPLDQILLLLYLSFFIKTFERIAREEIQESIIKKTFRLIMLWFLGIVAMRAKEPNMFLVPGLSWLLILFNPSFNLFKSFKTPRFKNLLLLCVVPLLLSLPVVFVKNRPETSQLGFNFFKNQFYIFFYNPEAYAGEKIFQLVSLKDSYPSTVLGNFGFLIGWAMILMIIGLIIQRRKRQKIDNQEPRVSYFLLLLVWSLVSLAFNGVYTSYYFTRYLVWVLLPFTLLILLGFMTLIQFLNKKWRIIISGLLVVFLSIRIVQNVSHSLYVRKGLERIWVPKWSFMAEICKDLIKKDEVSLFEVSKCWRPRSDFTKALEDHKLLYRMDSPIDVMQDAGFQEVLKKFGTAYITSDHPLDLPWTNRLVKVIDTSKLSLLTELRSRFTKKKPPTYYLYWVSV